VAKVANAVGEDLANSPGRPCGQRVQAVQARQGSPWDDLLGASAPTRSGQQSECSQGHAVKAP